MRGFDISHEGGGGGGGGGGYNLIIACNFFQIDIKPGELMSG